MSKIKKRLMAAVVKLVIMILLFNFPLIGSTNSYFSDQEASAGNRISAGDWTAPLVKIETPGDGATVSGSVGIYGTITDNAPHHYWLVVENSEGSVVAGPGVVSETNSLTNQLLYTWNTTLVSDGSYTIKLEARDAANNKDLDESVDWITVSVDNVLDEPSLTPTPTPTSVINVVINEVYYDVADDKGTEDKNEWIELYNNSETPVSLRDWSLEDAAGNTKTISPEISIPGHGFAVLSHDNSTWIRYWDLPEGAVVINIGGSAWLNNTDGDRLILKNKGGAEADRVSWEGTDGWNITANEGESIARKVKGADTDSVDDWEVLTNPNPGTNPYSDPAPENPQLELNISPDREFASFKVTNIQDFVKLSYELTYDTDTISDGVVGSEDLSGQDEYAKDGITLGTCSSGGTCVYYTGVYNIKLKVILEDSDGNPTALEKII